MPIAPTPRPPFRGAEDLNCGPIQGGDGLFGYCEIPGTDTYYVWAPCEETCPDAAIPGVDLRVVQNSTELLSYMFAIAQRDSALESRRDFQILVVGIGGLETVGGALTFGAACLVGSHFTFGASCAAWFAAMGAGGLGIWYSHDRQGEEEDDVYQWEQAAGEIFEALP